VRRALGLSFAALAIVLHAFWPLISQARPKSVALVPLCTIAGETHYAEVPLGKTPAEEKSASHFEHCSLCTLGAMLPLAAFAVFAEKSFFQARSEQASSFAPPFTVFAKPRAPPFAWSVDVIADETRRNNEEIFALRHRGGYAVDAGYGHRVVRGGVLLA
jgi:hypothetical protein